MALLGGLVTTHMVIATDNRWGKLVWPLSLRLLCTRWRPALPFLLWGMGHWLTWTIERTAKSVPNILTVYCGQCYKIQKVVLVAYGEMYVALLKCVLSKVRDSHACFSSIPHNLLLVTTGNKS